MSGIRHMMGFMGASFPESLRPLFSVLWMGQISGSTLIDESGNGNNITVTGKDFSGSYIPQASAATFSITNNAANIADDFFDALWFDDASATIQVTPYKLYNNDYCRTLVKYSDSSPYDIQWIGLLKEDTVLTTGQLNQLHTYFRLGIYWSGTFNDFGVFKENRPLEGLGYKGWLAEVQSLALTEPTELVKSSLNKLALEYRNEGVDERHDRVYNVMLNDPDLVAGCGTVALFGDRSVRLTFPVAPTYTAYGFEGDAATMYADTNFNPSVDGVNYSQNNASLSLHQYKIKTVVTAYLAGIIAGGLIIQAGAGSGLTRLNSTNNLTGSVTYNSIGYVAIDRNAASGAGSMRVIREASVNSYDVASTILPNGNILILRSASGYGDQGISAIEIGGSFTNAEHQAKRSAINKHKLRLGL